MLIVLSPIISSAYYSLPIPSILSAAPFTTTKNTARGLSAGLGLISAGLVVTPRTVVNVSLGYPVRKRAIARSAEMLISIAFWVSRYRGRWECRAGLTNIGDATRLLYC